MLLSLSSSPPSLRTGYLPAPSHTSHRSAWLSMLIALFGASFFRLACSPLAASQEIALRLYHLPANPWSVSSASKHLHLCLRLPSLVPLWSVDDVELWTVIRPLLLSLLRWLFLRTAFKEKWTLCCSYSCSLLSP